MHFLVLTATLLTHRRYTNAAMPKMPSNAKDLTRQTPGQAACSSILQRSLFQTRRMKFHHRLSDKTRQLIFQLLANKAPNWVRFEKTPMPQTIR